jgi:hypothetical protein
MNKFVTSLVIVLTLSSGITASASGVSVGLSFTRAANDFQRDMRLIVAGTQKFDANSAQGRNLRSISQAKRVFANNQKILSEIGRSVATLRSNLNKNRNFLPTRDTKDSPAFSTLIIMANGYDEWLKYQLLNQKIGDACLKKANKNLKSFKKCVLDSFSTTLKNEQLGRSKFESAIGVYNRWKAKYGYY